MDALISNFRLSRHTKSNNHMVLIAPGITNRVEAEALVDKKVTWKSSAGKEIHGKIASPHGNKGALRAIFETGMPGQAIGQKVTIQ
ncbi:50S ribosomal protein L35ae [Candidatus Woesearchaeota archaeon]|mgnify:CR=1 FL=1|jgi:large subunit ribosomal protein L35Ae|nr:50S ribosomal protein L35ae [Candidatus Woesearchaeota archaeon]MBT6044771.1 50S ribosomal protein L35ae [Candidatus Woesearchaeota archaeon]